MRSGSASTGAKRWLKRHQHAPLVRQALALSERAYELARRLAADERPAIGGGWPARWMPLPAPRPYGRRERRELARAMREQNTSFSDGDAVLRFEAAIARHWGTRHAIAVSSGTAALHAALIAGGVGPGDEVIVPVLTHVSTPLAVAYQGAAPRFVDACRDDWNVDAAKIEALVTPRTRAIVVVHLSGVPCDLDRIRAIAARHHLLLIEDAAHGHGAEYAGRKVGTLGDLGCLSFQSDKTMTTGEGGAVLTDDDELARRVRLATTLGDLGGNGAARSPAREDERGVGDAHGAVVAGAASGSAGDARTSLSWNYRIGALQAALGLGQLERLDAACAARSANAEHLWRALSDLPGLRRQKVAPCARAAYVFLFVELDLDTAPLSRDTLLACLDRERIEYRVPYSAPLARHAAFADGRSYPAAERICASGVGFRVDPGLGRRDMDAVGAALRRIFAWSRAR